MIGRYLYLLGLVILFASCTETEMEEIKPVFDGITETDLTGVVVNEDSNDWTFNANWSSAEENLFTEAADNVCSLENYLYKVVAYPNPCQDVCYLYINIPMEHRFIYRLVDNDFNVILSGETCNPSLEINAAHLKKSGQVLRLYYKIINLDNCELRGYGDISLQ